MISARDIREFRGFLRNATDRQVQGIYDKEARAGRDEYAELAVAEAERRGIYLEREDHARKKKSPAQLDREIAQALGGQRRAHARVGGSPQQAWDVSLGGRVIDTVFYDPDVDEDYVRRGLINHDGYDPRIKVRRRPRRGGTAHATKRGDGGHVKLEYDDPEIEQMFRESGSKGTLGEHDKTVAAVLGDPMYAQHFKMPKWNRKVTVLDTPSVGIRYWNELGLPRSKGAHQQRADHFRDLKARFDAEHQRLLAEGERAYGKEGSLIAGGFRENWPAALKDRIRFVSYGSSLLSDAARFHEALAKSRSPVFHW